MTQMSLFTDLTSSLPTTAAVNVPVIAPISSATSAPAEKIEQDTLLRLAELIRVGRAQMEARTQLRSRPIQSIGQLAQSVLQRHDLVARRRAKASNQLAAENQTGQPTVTCAPAVGMAQTPSEVHVAS